MTKVLIIAIPIPEGDKDFATTVRRILASSLNVDAFLKEGMTVCPNCGCTLQHDDSGDSPPVWCGSCGLGWPRVYPSQPVSPFLYIRSDNGNLHT